MTSCKATLCPFKDICDRSKFKPSFGDTYMIEPYGVKDGVTVCDTYVGSEKEYKKIKRSQTIKNVLKNS